jgi:hypothetical protein
MKIQTSKTSIFALPFLYTNFPIYKRIEKIPVLPVYHKEKSKFWVWLSFILGVNDGQTVFF